MTFFRPLDDDAPTDEPATAEAADESAIATYPSAAVDAVEPLPVTIYSPEKPMTRMLAPSLPIVGERNETKNAMPTSRVPTPTMPEPVPVPAATAATRDSKTAPATSDHPKERIPDDLRQLLDKGNEESAVPTWVRPAGWAAAGAAAIIVLGGLFFLGPRGTHVVEVGSHMDVAPAADSDDATPDFAAEDSMEEAGLESPDELGFVDDGVPPTAEELAEDGLFEEGAPPQADEQLSEVQEDPPSADAADEIGDSEQSVEDVGAPTVDDELASSPESEASGVEGEPFLQDTFDEISDKWTPLAGEWIGAAGAYAQQSAEGFDQIAQLEVDLPERYRVSVTMQPLDGVLGGGLLLGQQVSGDRAGAHVLEITDDGTFLSWGVYGEDGNYAYLAGIATPEGFNVEVFHILTAFIDENATVVSLDGQVVAEFGPVLPGRLGLITSESATSFDDLTIEAR